MNALPHATRLPDGRIEIMDFGVRRPVSRFEAIMVAAPLRDSPFEASRERAAAILKAVTQ